MPALLGEADVDRVAAHVACLGDYVFREHAVFVGLADVVENGWRRAIALRPIAHHARQAPGVDAHVWYEARMSRAGALDHLDVTHDPRMIEMPGGVHLYAHS